MAISKQPLGLNNAPFNYNSYWLSYGRDLLDNSIPTLQKKFTGYIKYLNTLSVASFLGSIGLTVTLQTTKIDTFIFLGIAIATLQLSKLYFSLGLLDNSATEIRDIRDPVLVHKAHNAFVAHLQNKLKGASIAVTLATIIFIIFVFLGINSETQRPTNNLIPKTQFCYFSITESVAQFKASLPDSTTDIRFELRGVSTHKKSTGKRATILLTVLPTQDSIIRGNYSLKYLYIKPDTAILYYKENRQIKSYIHINNPSKVTLNTKGK
ncbi:MAG: hypothetical protein R2800_09580 [Flavipsychrobacter sp.]